MEKLNRREFLKKAGALVVTLGVGPIVTACGSTTPAPTTAPVAPAAGATAVPVATKAVVATAVPEISGDLYFFSWYGQNWPDQLKAELGQLYPKLNLRIQNNMQPAEYLQAQKTRFLAGPGVMDVTDLRPESVEDYIKAGYLEDLTDLIKDFRDNYIEGTIANCVVNGRTYCVPGSLGAIGMWYNKKMFADRGLAVPKTWDELIKICETFKKEGIYAFTDAGLTSWVMEQTVYQFPQKVLVDDPEIFKKIAAGKAKYTDPVWVDCFKQIDAFYKAGYIDPASPGYDITAQTAPFINGKVPMYNQGDYIAGRIKPAPILDDIGVFPVPLPGTNKIIVPVTVINYLGINKSSNNKAAALAFMKWFADAKTGGLFYAKTLGFPPGVKGAKLDDKILSMWAPLYALPTAPAWHVLQGPAANAELLKSLGLLFLKKITPEQMAANIQKAQEEQK